MKRKKLLIALLMAVVLVTSIATPILAKGTRGAEKPAAASLAENEDKVTPAETLLSRVAEILGIEAAQLEAAIAQARREAQDEAVEAYLQKLVEQGKITPEQADQYKAWWLSRPDALPPIVKRAFAHFPAKRWQSGNIPMDKTLLAKVATILGIEQQKLADAFAQAKREAQEAALDAYLQKLVEQGKITQEQADQYKAWLKSKPDVPLPGPFKMAPRLRQGPNGKQQQRQLAPNSANVPLPSGVPA
ncbi:MAG: hypothetical protein HY670_09260 [Chloroflexi bacterium]|nr:hypothetical protein [Chloroflexota bacterium]